PHRTDRRTDAPSTGPAGARPTIAGNPGSTVHDGIGPRFQRPGPVCRRVGRDPVAGDQPHTIFPLESWTTATARHSGGAAAADDHATVTGTGRRGPSSAKRPRSYSSPSCGGPVRGEGGLMPALGRCRSPRYWLEVGEADHEPPLVVDETAIRRRAGVHTVGI